MVANTKYHATIRTVGLNLTDWLNVQLLRGSHEHKNQVQMDEYADSLLAQLLYRGSVWKLLTKLNIDSNDNILIEPLANIVFEYALEENPDMLRRDIEEFKKAHPNLISKAKNIIK
jgi:hypothetical protein